jgi:pimeloyl-ACP methyl ester carboxylesterase
MKKKHFLHSGIDLYHFTVGKGAPLLFLPGGLRVTTYKRNIEYLSKWYTVIAVDLPGFGKSSTPPTVWDLRDYANFLDVFINKNGYKNITMLGHSYGGGVGLYLAGMNKNIKKFVAFSPMGVASKHSRVRFYYNVLVTKSINDYMALRSNKMRALVFNNAISTITENFSNATKIFQITNKCLYRNVSEETLAKIQIPVKLIWGKHDELFPADNGKYLVQHLSKGELEIVNGNHDWWTIYPQKGGDKVHAFFSGT